MVSPTGPEPKGSPGGRRSRGSPPREAGACAQDLPLRLVLGRHNVGGESCPFPPLAARPPSGPFALTQPLISRPDIEAAHARIASHIRRTPVWTLPGAFGHDGPVSLKLEFLQHSGSFKARGAFN